MLCVGLAEFNAGKTSLTRALLRYLRGLAMSVVGFKPRSGIDLWYGWPVIDAALAEGTFHGRDAKLLWTESTYQPPVAALNPVHRLWCPHGNHRAWNGLPAFLVDRLVLPDRTVFIRNPTVEWPFTDPRLADLLAGAEVHAVETAGDFQRYLPWYTTAAETAHAALRAHVDVVVTESYSNVARPWKSYPTPDWVLAVRPFQLAIYEGARYAAACEVVAGMTLEPDAGRVVDTVVPALEVQVAPVTGDVVAGWERVLARALPEVPGFEASLEASLGPG